MHWRSRTSAWHRTSRELWNRLDHFGKFTYFVLNYITILLTCVHTSPDLPPEGLVSVLRGWGSILSLAGQCAGDLEFSISILQLNPPYPLQMPTTAVHSHHTAYQIQTSPARFQAKHKMQLPPSPLPWLGLWAAILGSWLLFKFNVNNKKFHSKMVRAETPWQGLAQGAWVPI